MQSTSRRFGPQFISCLAMVGFLILPSSSLAVTRFVDDDAPAAGDGQSWATAYRFLQDALIEAQSNATITEIRVAEGTYHPDDSEGVTIVLGSRTEAFVLQNDVTINGGFRGVGGGGSANDRDINLFVATLSGDLDDNDGAGFSGNGENSFHVVRADVGANVSAVLNGFEIAAGNADGLNGPGVPNDVGGGFYNQNGDATIVACRFVANSADGGGAIRSDDGNPSITSCEFIRNRGVSTGGGVYLRRGNAVLINGLFTGNTSSSGGGALRIDQDAPLVANCSFSGNTVTSILGIGGAVYFFGGSPTLVNCSFSGNFAGDLGSGGGLYYNDGSPTVTNCVIWGNRDFGGFDESAQIFDAFGGTTVRFCTIQDTDPNDAAIPFGGTANNNIDDNPNFITDPDPGVDGFFNGVNDNYGNLRLGVSSPCIDAGSNGAVPADTPDLNTNGDFGEPLSLDLAGEIRFSDVVVAADTGVGTGPIVDMGAYETEFFPRVTDSLLVLYDFRDGAGARILDVSSTGIPTDVFISDLGAVTWLSSALSVNSSTIATSIGPARRIIDSCKASGALTIEAWVQPASASQPGPARIATVSVNTSERNVSLLQGNTDYAVRLRTTTTNDQGEPPTTTPIDVATTGLTHLVFTRSSSGTTRIFVDEVEVVSDTVNGNLSNWNDAYRFALFNEFTLNRTWLGELHLLAVYAKALSPLEVSQNFIVGPNATGKGRTGDLDNDRDVDGDDYDIFITCLAGPESSTLPLGCTSARFDDADFDGDGDVDLADYRVMTNAFTGPI